MEADIGLVGLAVMGQNLALNIYDHGFTIAVNNRTTATTDDFISSHPRSERLIGTKTLEECIKKLKRPKKLLIMVKAGAAVDAIIQSALPFLEPGDLLIDGGNSDFKETNRRCQELASQGIHFLGAGISGGEDGARHGPSIMPGGSLEGWKIVQPIFEAIAAKAFDGKPCCAYIGESGAGHYVKMVHNGIEYGDMQLICEAYDLMHRGLEMPADQLAE
ncbi:MAG: NADP-dependent phosphogluconate dehydrogenase, partial [Chlamydiia bacterium]|nr:NADP-dependent phosphogluconate dehydrogenase [Chlamydiia bacterium]